MQPGVYYSEFGTFSGGGAVSKARAAQIESGSAIGLS